MLGTHGRSAGQHDAWASVFGPVGDDGYYKPLYDKVTGAIDPEVATYWRDHYDLRYILQRDWATLGPKLRGKIHITSGTMDNGYLNNAVYQMEEFLGHASAVARGRDRLRRAPRALLHGRHRASEQRRQPHRAPALHAGDGAVDHEDGAAGPTPRAGYTDRMLISKELAAAFNAQIGHEYGAGLQYIAIAAYFRHDS